jgi:hypothetical protein
MDEETSLKALKDRRFRVAREFRLNNLKRIADKNLALHKIAKKNTFTAIIFSLSTILFGAIFVFLGENSGITKTVENAVTGVGALIGVLSSLKDFLTKSTDDDCIGIKFSEVCDESVELSLKTTDEDDIRNTENTIECWCKWLHRMKSFYTTFTMFSSLLLIVFIIIDFTSQGKNVVQINKAIIIFGGISLIFVCSIRYSLKIFTFTGDGGKDVERLLNGMKIHIKRNTALELENLKKKLLKDSFNQKKSGKFQKIKEFFEFIFGISHKKNDIMIESLTGLVDERKDSKEDYLKKIEFSRGVKVENKDRVTITRAPKDIASWIWKLFTAMDGLDCILKKYTNSQSELNMIKLKKKLSLKELVVIIQDSKSPKYHYDLEATKLSVDYHILRELYGASKELLNIIEKENEKKNEQPSKKKSDEIEEEFSKISKKLEVIKQIIKKSKKLHTKEFTEFTRNLIKELDEKNGIKEKLKYINRWAEGLNNFSDPTSAQVDKLREEIPIILKSKPENFGEIKNRLKCDNRWAEDLNDKECNKNQTSKQENTNQLEEITNLPLKLYEIEKELSKTPEILKEIDQKIETPIEDLRYARKVHGYSKDKLDDIKKKLFEMQDNIRQDWEIDKVEKKLLKVFIDKSREIPNLRNILSNTLEGLKTKSVEDKISNVFIKVIEKNLSNNKVEELLSKIDINENYFKTEKAKEYITFIEELSKNSDNSEIRKIEKLNEKIDKLKKEKETSEKISRELKELLERLEILLKEWDYKVEEKFSKIHNNFETEKAKEYITFIEELSKNSDNSEIRKIVKLYKKIDELKKETSQKTSRELKELLELLEFLERLLKEWELENKLSNYKVEENFLERLLKEWDLKNKLSNYKVEEKFSKIHNNFETEKAKEYITFRKIPIIPRSER